MDLEKFGIGNGISEIIATTRSKSGAFNAAPMGIRNQTMARVYKASKTFENVKETGFLAANIVHDPMIFVISALENLDNEYFTLFHGFPVLKDGDAWVLFECFPQKEDSYAFTFFLKPIRAKINKKRVRAVNRGFNAVIEAAVHATRYVITGDEKLKRLIDHYSSIVLRCGGEREKEAMNYLKGRISVR
ncbi:MAG: DUF447 domain-containing protein [Candidatus Syntropharchaeia archaeon]